MANKAPLSLLKSISPPSKQLGEGRNAISYHEESVAWQCAFSRDGQWLAAAFGGSEPCVRLYSAPDWKLYQTLQLHSRTVRSVSFAPIKGLALAAASFDGTVSVWEKTENDVECIAQLEGHDSEVKAVAWNANASLLATCGRDKSVWIWETFLSGTVGSDLGGDFECVAVLNGHAGDVKCIKFAPSHDQWGTGEEILLSASYDDTIRVWAEDSGEWFCVESIASVHSATIWSIAIAPSGIRMVSASDDGSLAIYKCYSSKEKEQLQEETRGSNGFWKCVGKLSGAHSSTIYSVDYAPARSGHGRVVSGGADNAIRIYREARESTPDHPLFSLEAQVVTNGDVNCVCWHPFDGSLLASTGDDGTVKLWKYNPAR